MKTAVSKIRAADELDPTVDEERINELVGESIKLLRKDARVRGDE